MCSCWIDRIKGLALKLPHVVCQPACFFSLAWLVTFATRFLISVSRFQFKNMYNLVYDYIENISNQKNSGRKAM